MARYPCIGGFTEMNANKLGRRGFLSGIAGAATLPFASRQVAATPGYDRKRVALDQILAVSGSLGDGPSVDEGIVETARLIAPVYQSTREETRETLGGRASIYDLEQLDPETRIRYHHIRPVLKIAFELQGKFGVVIPNYRLLQVYWAGENLTTIGGILRACRALGEVSVEITRIEGDPVRNLTSEYRISFAVALLTLVAELAFAAIPISFNVAWRGTRFATNRALYRVRYYAGDATLAVVMSSVHWLLRGAPKRLVEYLISPETFEFVTGELRERASETEGFEPLTKVELLEAMRDVAEISREIGADDLDFEAVDFG